jgi:hypothetical protein
LEPEDEPVTRSEELRRQYRRVFRWSFAIAVLVHALVLFYGPWFRAEPMSSTTTELVDRASPGRGGIPIDVFFGPPAIADRTGLLSREPSMRVLSASRLVPPPYACTSNDWLARGEAVGEVRLTVNETGRIDAVNLTESTGDRCWDVVMQGLASDLLYRWLPNDRFGAPVEVYQPVTLSLTGY